MIVPKIEAVDFGRNYRLGVCFCVWFVFGVMFILAFTACFHWWVCLLVWLLSSFFSFLFLWVCVYVSLCDFVCFVQLLPFVLGFGIFYFFLPFLLWRTVGRILVLQLRVGPEPLKLEIWVQDTRPPETSRPHIILIGKSSPRDLHLNTRINLHPTVSKLQFCAPHAKQLARQEHNPTQ